MYTLFSLSGKSAFPSVHAIYSMSDSPTAAENSRGVYFCVLVPLLSLIGYRLKSLSRMCVGWLPDRHFTSPGVTKSEIALLFDGIIMCVTAASVLLCLFTLALTSDISKESLDSVHLPHSPIKEAHFENGEHNIEYDHDAVLGLLLHLFIILQNIIG